MDKLALSLRDFKLHLDRYMTELAVAMHKHKIINVYALLYKFHSNGDLSEADAKDAFFWWQKLVEDKGAKDGNR